MKIGRFIATVPIVICGAAAMALALLIMIEFIKESPVINGAISIFALWTIGGLIYLVTE